MVQIIPTSNNFEELRTYATALKKNIENFNFLVLGTFTEYLGIVFPLTQQTPTCRRPSVSVRQCMRLISTAYGELQYLRDYFGGSVLLSASAIISTRGFVPEFTEERKRTIKKFLRQIVPRLNADAVIQSYPVLTFKANVFSVDCDYSLDKLIYMAINQTVWQFEGQRQFAESFTFLFLDRMLKLSDTGVYRKVSNYGGHSLMVDYRSRRNRRRP